MRLFVGKHIHTHSLSPSPAVLPSPKTTHVICISHTRHDTKKKAFLPISADSLQHAYRLTEQLGLHPKDILSPSCSPLVLHHLLAGGE